MIGVCSFGSTGSGAVIDLLKEYNGICVKDKKEFILTYFPGGFEDLEFALMNQKAKFFSSDIAITRFKKFIYSICHNDKSFYWKLTDGNFNEMIDEYINKITQIQYQGRWMYDDYIFESNLHKIIFAIEKRVPFLNKLTLRDIYFSIKPDDFYKETKELLKKIYNYYNINETIVLDQPFPANNPLNSMKLFGDECKAIIVSRDPRDLYINSREKAKKISHFVPQDNLEKYMKFYEIQYKTKFNNINILYIQYEDLIFKYQETVEKIEKFCGINSYDHVNKFDKFDPKISIKNTRLFVKNNKYSTEIKTIEKDMSKYLYNFPM